MDLQEGNKAPLFTGTDQDGNKVSLKDFIGKKTTGKIILFRPSDAKKDLSMPLLLDSSLQQGIPLEKLSRGSWRIQIRWQCEGKDYYYEEDITI